MESLRKKLKTVQGFLYKYLPSAPNQSSPTDADNVIIPSFNPNFEVEKLDHKLQSPSLPDDIHVTNTVDDDDDHHHKTLDVERLDNASSKLQLNNFNEDCLLEIFSYLSLDDMMQVKRVCRKWRQASRHWFQQVQTIQTLFFTVDDIGNCIWELHRNYFKRKVCAGTETKKLLLFLTSYGHHIKYYKLHYDTRRHPNDKYEKFSYQSVPQLCKNIIDVEIQRRSQHRPSDFDSMTENWKKLEKLHIGHLPRFVGEIVHELLQNNQQLKIVKFQFKPDPRPPMNLEFFNYLPKTIEEIEMRVMLDISEEQFEHFISASKTFTSLRSLKFAVLDDSLSLDVMVAITNIKSLTHLSLDHFNRYGSRWTITAIANPKALDSYLVDNDNVDEDSFINIVESRMQLEMIDIFDWKRLTDKGMTAIAKLKRLKVLRIHAKNVTAKSIVNLPDSLEVFVCRNSKIYDTDAIKLLEKATNLRFMDLSICNNLTRNVLDAANEIANERKNNILYVTGFRFIPGFGVINTPYFKFSRNRKNIPLEIFPEEISSQVKKFYFL